MPVFPTWVRAQDEFGQFDVRKGDPLPDGVELVKGYPEHVGRVARNPKPRTNKDGTDYTKQRVDDLRAEASRRGLDPDGNKPDLVERLETADETALPGFPPDEAIHPEITEADTGSTEDSGSNTEAANSGEESD